jgi:HlyD family secretion protein
LIYVNNYVDRNQFKIKQEGFEMKRTILISGVVFVVSLAALMVFLGLTRRNLLADYAEVQQGYFEISVEAMGELIAENSVDIIGPNVVGNRKFRAAPIKIIDMVPEGTVVKAGDFIAEMDRSSFLNTMRDEQEELREAMTNYEAKVLDSAVVLSQLRDEIRNQQYVVSEAVITREQSKYEPPATQRQAEITVERETRSLEQKKRQYALKRAQVRAELMTLKLKVNTQQRVVDDFSNILTAFTVKAPADGMVIYKRDRMGQKIRSGTNVNPWDPVVATLPDLSSMLSKVFISEIDINKVSHGLPVEMTIDAFPDRYFQGEVYKIANIGEQLPNSDSKVFEVLVKINDYDPELRPSMTTSNKVIVRTYHDVLFVPNQSVHAGVDSVPYVYTRDGRKQIVVLGEADQDKIIIEQGLKAGTDVWLSIPENPDKFSLAGQELIPVIREKERELARLEEERLRPYNPVPEDYSALETGGMGSSAEGDSKD